MKTIKLLKEKAEIRDYEALPQLWKYFKNYFNSGINHTTIFTLVENTAYFYCDVYIEEIKKIPEKTPVVVDTELKIEYNKRVFYDCDLHPFSKKEFEKRSDVILTAKDDESRKKIIGFYIKDKNILIATDWTHRRELEDYIKIVMKKLKPFLKEIEKKEEKELVTINSGKISIGADAEIELIKNNSIISAGYYYNYSHKNIEFVGGFGVDGSDNQIELRPDYTFSEIELVDKISILISEINDYLSPLGRKYPCGFHIHFGYNENPNILKHFMYEVAELLARFNKELFENTVTQKVRRSNDYGYDDEIRTQSWGVEYRGVPSLIIGDKELMRIVLKLYYSAVKTLFAEGEITLKYDTSDYFKFITYNEYVYMIEKIRELDEIAQNNTYYICNYIYNSNFTLKIDISFSDLFSESIKEKISDYINNILSEDEKMKIQYIRIFSLHRKRGAVVDGFITDKYINIQRTNKLYSYGLPHNLIKYWNETEDIDYSVIDDIITAIRYELEKSKKITIKEVFSYAG